MLSPLQGDCGSETDPYADYEGSLRCLMEGAGDVAFTKHTTALEVASDGTTPQTWSSLAKVGWAGCHGGRLALHELGACVDHMMW
jgi:hypothetical protein